MNFKAGEKEAIAAADEEAAALLLAGEQKEVEKQQQKKQDDKQPQVSQEDLFSAHDFDIKIDFEVPIPGGEDVPICFRPLLIVRVGFSHISECFAQKYPQRSGAPPMPQFAGLQEEARADLVPGLFR